MNTWAKMVAGLGLAVSMPVSGWAVMDMTQTLSDQAQGMTIAFDGVAFLTGSLGADSFLPPGKVADFSGFQYLRDNDPTEMGHNTDFVTIIARNVLNILTGAQITQMVERAETQIDRINQYGYMRFPLMKAFRNSFIWADFLKASVELPMEAIWKRISEGFSSPVLRLAALVQSPASLTGRAISSSRNFRNRTTNGP